MKKQVFLMALLLGGALSAQAQNQARPAASPRPTPTAPAQPQRQPFDLSEYGVRIQPDARLIVVMAALDAAGFEAAPANTGPGSFRERVRKDQAELPADLRARLRRFYEAHRLPAEAKQPPTPAEQASRYVSLAYALGPAPSFEAPARTDDLPGGLLEVLDFAPLVREFYRQSGIDERLPEYLRFHQAAGDEMRQETAAMVRTVLSYLHTRPQTSILERVPVKSPGANEKKNAPQIFSTRERERRFFIVPDLMAASGTINFRIIGDDYYAIVPFGTNPTASELRRAYLQFVVDPLILRHNREIAGRRDELRKLIDEVAKLSPQTLSPDVFLTISRSLVVAAETRLDELAKLDALTRRTQAQLAATTDAAQRASIVKESQAARARIQDEAIAELSDAYERGAVLAFYFTEQLRGTETSGFDISSSFADMIVSFDAARETRRLTENAEARARGLELQKSRRVALDAQRDAARNDADENSPRAVLLKKLIEVDSMLRLRNYPEAEARLRALLLEFPGEARVFFALGETASLSAREATDEEVRDQRLDNALVNYGNAVRNASAESEPGLLSRAHQARGSILAFLNRRAEALAAFEAAIKIGPDVPNNAYEKAVEGKKKLMQPQ